MSHTQLAGRRALVTGAGSGIGASITRGLAAAGVETIVADVNAEAAGRIADEVGGTPWVIDLGATEELEELSLDVDILVNNAGLQRIAPIVDFEPDAFREIQRLMVEAPFLLMRAALPGMYQRRWGRIVNISSAHGLRASPFKSAYVTAKHGLQGLSKVAALEGGRHGVTSNCVNPGYVRTPLVEKQISDQARIHGIGEDEVLGKIMLTETAIKRLVEPEEVASLVLWLCSTDAGMVNGSSYVMDGGWTAR